MESTTEERRQGQKDAEERVLVFASSSVMQNQALETAAVLLEFMKFLRYVKPLCFLCLRVHIYGQSTKDFLA